MIVRTGDCNDTLHVSRFDQRCFRGGACLRVGCARTARRGWKSRRNEPRRWSWRKPWRWSWRKPWRNEPRRWLFIRRFTRPVHRPEPVDEPNPFSWIGWILPRWITSRQPGAKEYSAVTVLTDDIETPEDDDATLIPVTDTEKDTIPHPN